MRISVVNEQRGEGFSDTVSEASVCKYRSSGDKFYITYETEESKVMIKLEDGAMYLKRAGEYGSGIAYIPGERTAVDYRTPYGIIAMDVYTDLVEYELSESGGVIELSYTLGIGGDGLENRMKIKIER